MPIGKYRWCTPGPRSRYVMSVLVGFLAATGMAIGQEGTSGMSPATLDELATNANIIFVGTVTGPGASSAEGAVEARIETTLKAPVQLGPLDGALVILVQGQAGALAANDRYVFFTQTQLLGDRLTLREIGRTQAAAAGALSKELQESDRRVERLQLSTRLKAADAVIVGRVMTVQRDMPEPAVPVSEHDPQWMRATIEVEDVLSGAVNAKELALVFPGTMDVAWVGVPRPEEGQQAVWLLTSDPDLGAYKVLDPLDVQSVQRTDEIGSLLQPLQ